MGDKVFKLTSLQSTMSETVNDMANRVMNETGRRGILSITVTEDFGLALGIPPGHEAIFNTSVGPVTVRSAVML